MKNQVSFWNQDQFSPEIFEVLPDANMLNKKVTYIITFFSKDNSISLSFVGDNWSMCVRLIYACTCVIYWDTSEMTKITFQTLYHVILPAYSAINYRHYNSNDLLSNFWKVFSWVVFQAAESLIGCTAPIDMKQWEIKEQSLELSKQIPVFGIPEKFLRVS